MFRTMADRSSFRFKNGTVDDLKREMSEAAKQAASLTRKERRIKNKLLYEGGRECPKCNRLLPNSSFWSEASRNEAGQVVRTARGNRTCGNCRAQSKAHQKRHNSRHVTRDTRDISL
jgi:hypothetical protein